MLDKLPELVIYRILDYIDSPFDMISLGLTCKTIRGYTMSPQYWVQYAYDMFDGLWMLLENIPSCETHPRDWFLSMLRRIAARPNTKDSCYPGESWKRLQSVKFNMFVGLLRLSYAGKSNHPAVLMSDWIYDIALFERNDQKKVNFTDLERHTIQELADLGQAKSRDLRARKRPHIDPTYYIKKDDKIYDNLKDPFNVIPGDNETDLCPLLIPPEQAGCESHDSNYYISLSIALARHLKSECLNHKMSLTALTKLIQGVKKMNNLEQCVDYLDSIGLPGLKIVNNAQQLRDAGEYKQIRKKHQLKVYNFIINHINKGPIIKIRLTDSDLLGGDNYRQEMASAAFIGPEYVLVVWHLIGRLRF